jgi:hypothetical protein
LKNNEVVVVLGRKVSVLTILHLKSNNIFLLNTATTLLIYDRFKF